VTSGVVVRRVHADEELSGPLAQVVMDCVEGGASVGFMSPVRPEEATSHFEHALQACQRGERILLVAEDHDDGDRVIGTVQVVLAMPENQPHRGEITKMLVTRSARRRGVGEVLMRQAETYARGAGKTLLVLDTASADAERLYERLGWQKVGVIPRYALGPTGDFVSTTVYYKDLA
jgi:GNAT superfamily N-acetyltransferase